MATAGDMIKRSLRLIGSLGSGETPTAEEQGDALEVLNSMLETWSANGLDVYALQKQAFTWTAASASLTYGPSGDITAVRPIRVVIAYQTVDSIDYPITLLGWDRWLELPDKTTQSTLVDRLWVQYTHPDLTLYAYPVPSANLSVTLLTHTPIPAFTSGTTTVALPPGYQRAIEYNLAMELAPEYDRTIPPSVAVGAASSRYSLQRINHRPVSVNIEAAALGRHGDYIIEADSFR